MEPERMQESQSNCDQKTINSKGIAIVDFKIHHRAIRVKTI